MKLPGGIFGKTCHVLIYFCIATLGIAWAARNEIVSYIALGVLTLVVLYVVHRMFDFAKENPEVAILEGAEYVTYQRLRLAQKGKGQLPMKNVTDADDEVLLPEEKAVLDVAEDENAENLAIEKEETK